MRATSREGQRLDDIRSHPTTPDEKTAVRRLIEERATNPDDCQTLLQMLGLEVPAAPEAALPPPEAATPPPAIPPCAGCGADMFRAQWPEERKQGRVRLIAKGLCQRCYHNAYYEANNPRTRPPSSSANTKKRTRQTP